MRLTHEDAVEIVEGFQTGAIDELDLICMVENPDAWITESTSSTAEKLREIDRHRPRRPSIPLAEVRHDQDEVTFAVTFKWARPWAMDHCEVGHLSRQLREAIVDTLGEGITLTRELVAVETWEPNEERHIGTLVRGLPMIPAGEDPPFDAMTEGDEWVADESGSIISP